LHIPPLWCCNSAHLHVPGELNAHSTRKPNSLSVQFSGLFQQQEQMMAVVIFGGELKLPSSFICGRRKIFSIKSNPSVVESIIPCQKQRKMDQLKWNHVWSLLHGDSAGSIVPQLLTLVFLGLIMISYTAWYMTNAALVHGQVASYYFLSTHLPKQLKKSHLNFKGPN
jgi:hypothetical protein